MYGMVMHCIQALPYYTVYIYVVWPLLSGHHLSSENIYV